MNDMTPHDASTATPTGHSGIYRALAAAQTAMGKAVKETTNNAFRTKYADLGSVMDACLPALNSNGIAVYQPPCVIGETHYVKTILAHESGETLECSIPLIIGKNDMQGYGSAVTYARRYGLMAMAGIAPEDDDGNAAAKAAPVAQRQLTPPPKPQGPAPANVTAPNTAQGRDPKVVQAALLKIISKADTVEYLGSMNDEGSKSAEAWQWLEDEHPDLAVGVKEAFEARMKALDDFIPY